MKVIKELFKVFILMLLSLRKKDAKEMQEFTDRIKSQFYCSATREDKTLTERDMDAAHRA